MKNMKINKKLLIALILVVLGGVLVLGIQHKMEQDKIRQEQLEVKRNKEYEEDLVQALKNSYRDIEEIKLSNPVYSRPPGDWSCNVTLKFDDGNHIKYQLLSHDLGMSVNKSAVAQSDVLNQLDSYFGKTDKEIKVTYSDGREAVE